MRTFRLARSLTRELEDSDNAGRDTKRAHMEDRNEDTIKRFGGGAERDTGTMETGGLGRRAARLKYESPIVKVSIDVMEQQG